MANSLVLTICAHDRPGVMKLISNTIAQCDGNWLESRMARLGGQFAGIVRVECSEEKLSQLTENLNSCPRKASPFRYTIKVIYLTTPTPAACDLISLAMTALESLAN